MIVTLFLIYCFGAGMFLKRLIRDLPIFWRISYLFVFVNLHMLLAYYLEKIL